MASRSENDEDDVELEPMLLCTDAVSVDSSNTLENEGADKGRLAEPGRGKGIREGNGKGRKDYSGGKIPTSTKGGRGAEPMSGVASKEKFDIQIEGKGGKGRPSVSSTAAAKVTLIQDTTVVDNSDYRMSLGILVSGVVVTLQGLTEWKCMVIGTTCMLCSSGTTLALPILFGQITDKVIANNDIPHDERKSQLTVLILKLGGMQMVGAFFSLIQSYTLSIASSSLVTNVRLKLFKAVTLKEISFFDATLTGELTSRLSSDVTVLGSGLTDGLAGALPSLFIAIGGFLYLFTISWQLTLVMCFAIPSVLLLVKYFGGKISEAASEVQKAIAISTAEAGEAISNIRTVRLFSAEAYHYNLYETVAHEAFTLMKHAAILSSGFGLFMRITITVVILFVIWYGAMLVIDGELTVGTMTSYVMLVFTIAGSFGQLVFLTTALLRTAGATERIFDIINGACEKNIHEGLNLPVLKGEIRLEQVDFYYPSRPDVRVLNALSLTVRPNNVTALVGPSGSGKSTVMSLIARLYHPTAGGIYMDGYALQDIDLRSLHRHVVTVNQEPILFSGSIGENILYGVEEEFRSEQHMREAAEIANAHGFITGFPDGYHTLVGERGVQLSGGQKQRVAIARAIIRQPKILLLDEATSALDSENESLVQEALNRCMEGCTSLVIAHRLATVKDADMVYVIEAGQVAANGTHSELMETCELYSNLVHKQMLTWEYHREVPRAVFEL